MNLYHYSNNHASNLRDGANAKIATFANKYGIDVPVDKNPRDGATTPQNGLRRVNSINLYTAAP